MGQRESNSPEVRVKGRLFANIITTLRVIQILKIFFFWSAEGLSASQSVITTLLYAVTLSLREKISKQICYILKLYLSCLNSNGSSERPVKAQLLKSM
jgi:hypothetical protein